MVREERMARKMEAEQKEEWFTLRIYHRGVRQEQGVRKEDERQDSV